MREPIRRHGEKAILAGALAVLGAVAGILSCAPADTGTDQPPASPNDARFRANAGEDIAAGEGDEVGLRARGINGKEPYHFRWNIERRPEGAGDVSLSSETGAEVRTSALTVQGRYVFRLVVTDDADHDAYDFVTVTVGPPGTGQVEPIDVRIEGPDQLEPGETGRLRGIVDADTNGLTFLWEAVTDDPIVFDSPDQLETEFTVNTTGVVVVRFTAVDDEANAAGSAEHTIDVKFEGALEVTVEGPPSVEVNQTIEVTATPANAVGEVTFAWSVADGEAELTNADQATVSAQPTAVGRLALRVDVTDPATESSASAEYVVTVGESTAPLDLTASGPDILRVGEPGPLSVEIEGEEDFDEVQHRWRVIAGDATFDDPEAAEPNLISSNGETVQVRVTVTATTGENTRSGSGDLFVVTYEGDRPEVVFTVAEFGQFVFELRPDVSPKTVANFLRYVDDDFYNDILIHRVVADFVIQAGGFKLDENGELEQLEVRDPVESEADNGLSNVRGTVAMAQRGGDVNSGTSQWFVNLVDNTEDGEVDLDAQNFTVFATVSEGMDVVDEIAAVEVGSRSGLENVPVEDIIIESAERR